jgi:hypothetical protein
MPTAAQKG